MFVPDLGDCTAVVVDRSAIPIENQDGILSDVVTLYIPNHLLDTLQATEEQNNNTDYSAVEILAENIPAVQAQSEQDKIRTRKRKRNLEKNKRVLRKKLRNSGHPYVSTGGKLCTEKCIGPDCNCRLKCFDNVDKNCRESVFANFWAMGDFNRQNSYLFGQIRCYLPKRRRTGGISSQSRKTVQLCILC